ncbi:hypothetical protein PSN13_00755 [Micromonospora saelicesensis]|uniref:YdbS-like PH domain-containing protein n=1 Tax=Micromonospora saelicesensis TaxID=285676 RepID=A0A328P157_9ACTN|nr:PH domain-containing protein [Micromonospora saelicesensis]RAO39730.1 hypothetical protein PSN13_00755 [Micromonospora saelicesensis]
MRAGEVLFGVVTGILINEASDISPWLARRLVAWAAFRRYSDPQWASTRAQEFIALIDERPGKLFKLLTALGFAASAQAFDVKRRLSAWLDMTNFDRLSFIGKPFPTDRILWAWKPHWIRLTAPAAVGLAGTFALGSLSGYLDGTDLGGFWVSLCITAWLGVQGVFIRSFLRWRRSPILITDDSFAIVESRKAQIWSLNEVESVSARQSRVGRILNYGTVVIRLKSGETIQVKSVPAPWLVEEYFVGNFMLEVNALMKTRMERNTVAQTE